MRSKPPARACPFTAQTSGVVRSKPASSAVATLRSPAKVSSSMRSPHATSGSLLRRRLVGVIVGAIVRPFPLALVECALLLALVEPLLAILLLPAVQHLGRRVLVVATHVVPDGRRRIVVNGRGLVTG